MKQMISAIEDEQDLVRHQRCNNPLGLNADNSQISGANNFLSNRIFSPPSFLHIGLNEFDQSHEIFRMLESGKIYSNDHAINTANFQRKPFQNGDANKNNANNNKNTMNYPDQQRQQDLTEIFTRQNEISIHAQGADKRRRLLNNIDEDLINTCTKRQSIFDISSTFEDSSRPSKEISADSLSYQQHEQKGKMKKNKQIKENENGINYTSTVNGLNIQQKKYPSITNFIQSEQLINNLKSKQIIEYIQSDFQSIDVVKQTSKEESIEPLSCELGRLTQSLKHNPYVIVEKNISERNLSSHQSQPDKDENTTIRPISLIYMRRFINQLKKSIYSSLYRNLKIHQIKLINDIAYYQEGKCDELPKHKKKSTNVKENFSINNDQQGMKKIENQAKMKYFGGIKGLCKSQSFCKIKSVANCYQIYLKDIVISSQSNFIMLFQTCLLLSIFIQIYIIPLRICFNFNSSMDYPYKVFTMLTLPVFFIEIILNCITSYYQEGLEVRKQKKIIKNYIKNYFIGDVITFSTLILSLHSNQIWISLIFLIRLERIPQLINAIDDHFQLEHRFASSFELLKLVLLIVTIGHYFGCGFNYLGQIELRNHEYNWLQYKKIENKSWDIQYLNGLYFSFITMITVGYGDITPQTNKEIIYVLFMTLISCGIFGYSINTIGSIFREIQIRKSELKRQKYEVSYYMRNRNIPKNIQIKVMKELEHFQIRQMQDGQKGDQVLQQLSFNIRNEVKKEYFGKILFKYKLLKLNFSDQFIEQLSLRLKELFLSPDEIVLQQGELLNKVFCLVTGELLVYQEKQFDQQEQIVVGKIKKGEFSDQRALFFEQKIEYGLKSAGISQLVYFTNEDFISTLKIFPQEYEKYSMLKDNMIFQQKYIDLKCYCCGQYGHYIDKCQMVHYVADRELTIIKQNNKKQAQCRVFFNRSSKKNNTLQFKEQTNSLLREFRIKMVQQFFPSYQPQLPKCPNDEQFLSVSLPNYNYLLILNISKINSFFYLLFIEKKVPEIYMEGGGLFINIDEFIEEEDDFNTHLLSEKENYSKKELSSTIMTLNAIPIQIQRQGTIQITSCSTIPQQKQESTNTLQNIQFNQTSNQNQNLNQNQNQNLNQNQNQNLNQNQNQNINQNLVNSFSNPISLQGEREKAQFVNNLNDSSTPKSIISKTNPKSSSQLEILNVQQRSPTAINQGQRYQSFANIVAQNAPNLNNIQYAIQNTSIQQAPNQNFNLSSNQQNPKLSIPSQFQNEEISSIGGQNYSLYQINQDLNSSISAESIFTKKNSIEQNNNNYNNSSYVVNSIPNIVGQTQSQKVKKQNVINQFSIIQGQNNSYANPNNKNNNMISPKIGANLNIQNPNFTQIYGFQESQNQKISHAQISQTVGNNI